MAHRPVLWSRPKSEQQDHGSEEAIKIGRSFSRCEINHEIGFKINFQVQEILHPLQATTPLQYIYQ